jgi:hypothetical protein
MNWARVERNSNRGRNGKDWARFLNAWQTKWQGRIEIKVTQPEFECAYGGVGCTHVRTSCHVWEFLNSKARFGGNVMMRS